MEQKEIDIQNPLDPAAIISPCCEAARGKNAQAYPTLRQLPGGGHEYGYVLDTGDACACKSRWIAHNWQKHGHAQFVQAPGGERLVSDAVTWLDTTDADYHDMLGAVPPVVSLPSAFLVGEAMDHRGAKGEPRYTGYACVAGKYVRASRPLTVEEFLAHVRSATAKPQ